MHLETVMKALRQSKSRAHLHRTTHSRECSTGSRPHKAFTLNYLWFQEEWMVRDSFGGGSCSSLLACHRGGRDRCTSPSWNAPLPSLSVSVFPIHDGLYPALLYVSSYAHAPVLSLSLWHVSLNKQKFILECYWSKYLELLFQRSKIRKDETHDNLFLSSLLLS